MQAQTQTFVFNNNPIRFVGTPDKPEWVASDLLPILFEVTDRRSEATASILNKIPSEWRGEAVVQTTSGPQKVPTLFEAGVYYIIAGSRSAQSLPLWHWMFEEILPQLRQIGSCTIYNPHEVQERLKLVRELIALAKQNHCDQDQELRTSITNILRETAQEIHHSVVDPPKTRALRRLQSAESPLKERLTGNGAKTG